MRKVTRDKFETRSKNVKRFLSDLPDKMAKEFQKVTPIRTGNARNNTSLRNQKNITADYPYATRLEKDGWSRQAPNGMSEPTIEFARDLFRRLR